MSSLMFSAILALLLLAIFEDDEPMIQNEANNRKPVLFRPSTDDPLSCQ
jgi:hypothetical protein